jgi:crotonobetainyl-CoA:carnitine CoA-transferase CaiB-like acyl-CoA transferase
MMSLAFEGFTVLDLTHLQGPYRTFLLASAGAIEIEPAGGEHLRTRQAGTSAALAFAPLNARKRSLQLDLKTVRAGRRHAGREFRARRHRSPRAASLRTVGSAWPR